MKHQLNNDHTYPHTCIDYFNRNIKKPVDEPPWVVDP